MIRGAFAWGWGGEGRGGQGNTELRLKTFPIRELENVFSRTCLKDYPGPPPFFFILQVRRGRPLEASRLMQGYTSENKTLQNRGTFQACVSQNLLAWYCEWIHPSQTQGRAKSCAKVAWLSTAMTIYVQRAKRENKTRSRTMAFSYNQKHVLEKYSSQRTLILEKYHLIIRECLLWTRHGIRCWGRNSDCRADEDTDSTGQWAQSQAHQDRPLRSPAAVPLRWMQGGSRSIWEQGLSHQDGKDTQQDASLPTNPQ